MKIYRRKAQKLANLAAGSVLGLGLLATPGACSEGPIPPAFGPYIRLQPKDFAGVPSFKNTDRLVGTYYFYWYCAATKEHILNPENGSDGLTDHPPTLEDFSYKSITWHRKQLSDMMDAGIDVALMVFWGAPSERDPKASLYWSYAGLGPLVQAREELEREGKRPPRLGLFYDTSTLQYNAWGAHLDLTTDYGKRWFYATVRDFFSAIPPRHWAMIDGKAIVLLYAAAFARKHDQGFVDYTKAQFAQDFGREPYLAPQDSWQVKGDNTCAWGGAFGVRNPGIGELGPGYNDSAVYGRKPLIAPRQGGKFYEESWLKFLRRPSNFVMLETWSEFHEGTEICESKEYGRQYIDLTRKYAALFKQGWTPPWPKGAFTGASSVALGAGQPQPAGGLRLVEFEDGKFVTQNRAGRQCWQFRPVFGRSAYAYFQLNDSFKWDQLMNAKLTVEYLDAAPGWLGVDYDGSNRDAPLLGAYTPTPRIKLEGDGKWKTASFPLRRANFANAQNGGADLRVSAETRECVIGKVALERR